MPSLVGTPGRALADCLLQRSPIVRSLPECSSTCQAPVDRCATLAAPLQRIVLFPSGRRWIIRSPRGEPIYSGTAWQRAWFMERSLIKETWTSVISISDTAIYTGLPCLNSRGVALLPRAHGSKDVRKMASAKLTTSIELRRSRSHSVDVQNGDASAFRRVRRRRRAVGLPSRQRWPSPSSRRLTRFPCRPRAPIWRGGPSR